MYYTKYHAVSFFEEMVEYVQKTFHHSKGEKSKIPRTVLKFKRNSEG